VFAERRRAHLTGEALALLVASGAGMALALRGRIQAGRDYRRIVREGVNGSALVVARVAIRTHEIRLVKQTLMAAAALSILRADTGRTAYLRFAGLMAAVAALHSVESLALARARRDAEAIERQRQREADDDDHG
jgi:hypothetical protein